MGGGTELPLANQRDVHLTLSRIEPKLERPLLKHDCFSGKSECVCVEKQLTAAALIKAVHKLAR